MRSHVLLLIFIITIQLTLGRQLILNAIYYDTSGTPYKIEQKYSDSDGVLYVNHNNWNSVCIKKETFQHADTTIVKETYYSIYTEKTKMEKFMDCDNLMVITQNDGKEVKLQGYQWEKLLADTILTGEDVRNSGALMDNIKKARVPMILKEQIFISLDSLIPQETIYAYYLRNIPVKFELYDNDNKKYATTLCDLSTHQMYCKRYFTKDSLPYQVDTITWNEDTTRIVWHSIRFEWKYNSTSRYAIKDNHLNSEFGNGGKKKIEYLNEKNIFHNILVNDLIYTDDLYIIELRQFEREKTVNYSKDNTNYHYRFDSEGKIIEQKVFVNKILQSRVVYDYKKE